MYIIWHEISRRHTCSKGILECTNAICRIRQVLTFSVPGPVYTCVVGKKKTKNILLDANVILHDYRCIYQFEDNDIVLPIIVLEELGKFKKGNGLINFHAREFTRERQETRRRQYSVFSFRSASSGFSVTGVTTVVSKLIMIIAT